MQITLFDRDKTLCEQWEKDFSGYENIKVIQTDFSELEPHDCIVSPANSFGLMDGGFDQVLSDYFTGIQESVQKRIKSFYSGMQPLGSCLLIKTFDEKFPYLAHIPTMLYPSDVSNSIHAFLAFKALLHTVEHYDEITSVACCGLAYGTGGMSAYNVSKQMKIAYGTRHDDFNNWNDVQNLFAMLS